MAATLGLLVLAGCASTTPPGAGPAPAAAVNTPEGKVALVRERALSRWALLIKDDMDAAYAYMSPGSKEIVTLAKFKANFRRGAFRDAKVDNVACDGDACVVKLYVTYDHTKMKGITTPVSESWIVDGGQAWYVYGGK
ncbi:MAG: hypothetical protein U1F54_19125 [Burkholderiales bacterium]